MNSATIVFWFTLHIIPDFEVPVESPTFHPQLLFGRTTAINSFGSGKPALTTTLSASPCAKTHTKSIHMSVLYRRIKITAD
jgi:hypothetical protein